MQQRIFHASIVCWSSIVIRIIVAEYVRLEEENAGLGEEFSAKENIHFFLKIDFSPAD